MVTQSWGHREPEKLGCSTTNGNGHRGGQRVCATMRMKTIATVGALASCVLASRKRHSVVGASPPGSTQQVRFASGSRGGRAAAPGMHTDAHEGERKKRTHKWNDHENGGGLGEHEGGRSNMNNLMNATAIRRPPPLAVDGVIWPDKHSPYGLQCATRCRYGKQIYRKIGTRKCS